MTPLRINSRITKAAMTLLWVDDGSDDGTTECRTNLIELIFVVLINHGTLHHHPCLYRHSNQVF